MNVKQRTFGPVRSAVAELVQFTFQVAVLTSIGMYLLDAVFPDAVEPFLPLGTLLLATGALAMLSALFPTTPHHPTRIGVSKLQGLRTVVGLIAAVAIAAVLLWAKMRDLGSAAVGLTAIAVGIVALLLIFLGLEDEGIQE